MKKREAFWTYDDCEGLCHAYYFAPTGRTPPPYLRQIHVTAILDIASDGTLAGVELVMGDLPPPPELKDPPPPMSKVKETIVTDEIVEKAVSAYLNAEAAGGSSVYPPALRAALTAIVDDLVRGEREMCELVALRVRDKRRSTAAGEIAALIRSRNSSPEPSGADKQ